MRRYFVVNGFDGALTMFGLSVGFRLGGDVSISSMFSACLGAAIALSVSGITSAYVSESAERQREFKELQNAMLAPMTDSTHAAAVRWVPVLVAIINGLAPLLLSLAILSPLYLASIGLPLPLPPLDLTALAASIVVFLLGVFLGHVSGQFWLWAGLRAVLIAALTAGLIYVLSP
jgi:predicted membrane protein (TIGR00267 family)